MKILLTGASGFLGTIIKNHLNRSFEIVSLGRSNKNIFQINLESNIPSFNCRFDIVIHAAGKAHKIPKNKKEISDFFASNYIGTRNLLEGLEKSGIPQRFIFISSVSVYGLTSGNLIKEDTPLLAKDPYGKSKIMSEFLILKWCQKNDVICTILRLPLILGPNPPGNLDLMIKGIKGGYYFNISGYDAQKSMVLATDVAKYIIKASEFGGIYNLTDGFNPKFSELSLFLANQLEKKYVPVMPKYIALFFAKIGDIFGEKFPINTKKLNKITSTLTFDDSKARDKFDWKPEPVIENFSLFETFLKENNK